MHFSKTRQGYTLFRVVPAEKVRSAATRTKMHPRPFQRMIKEMPYITEHLSGLRQEISDLQNMNVRYAGKRVHSDVDQTALELRTNRLREIKQELSKMLDRPQDSKVWWERSPRTGGAAIAE